MELQGLLASSLFDMNRSLYTVCAAFLLALNACVSNNPNDNVAPIIPSSDHGVYIANEGNFQFGNAGISYFEEGMEDAIVDLFEPANGRPLGDVCQSMFFFNQKIYIVVNNSGKVEVVDATSFQSEATISGFGSPRYFLPISNRTAYVTDLFADAISIVDLSSQSIEGSIPCDGWTEEMALAYGKVFVTNRLSDQLLVINTTNNNKENIISIGYGAASIVEDRDGKLWALCSGRESIGEPAGLYRVDPIDLQLEQALLFSDLEDSPSRLNINGSLDSLYYLNNGVYRLSIYDATLPESDFIPADDEVFYGLGIDLRTGDVYVADAIDYVQRGLVYVYRSNGELKDEFLAGIIPGNFYFN